MSKSLDRLTLLATFARIAERGSISAAARDLRLSQASASRQLAELEQRLGAQLVRRTTHHLSLTPAGADALADARALLEDWEALAERFSDDGATLSGRLKVVAPVALGQTRLVDAALEFRSAHPGVEVEWLLSDDEIRFAEVGCDLWIKIGQPKDDTLIVRPLGDVTRIVVAAPGLLEGWRINHPRDLLDLPCVTVGPFEGAAIPLSGPEGAMETIRAHEVFATNNIFSALAAASAGAGYAIMPAWLVQGDLNSGALVETLPGWRAPTMTVSAAYLPARRQTRRFRAFLEHVARSVGNIPGIEPTAVE